MITRKKIIMNIVGALCLMGQCALLCSCEQDIEDGSSYPNYRTDFYDVVVSPDSVVKTLILDDGSQYEIKDSDDFQAHVCDTIIRCFGSLAISADSTNVEVFTVRSVLCFAPSDTDSVNVKGYYKAPVSNVVAVYKARSYINAIFDYKTMGTKDHPIDMIKDSVTESNGKKMMHISYAHWRPLGELDAYSQRVYSSVPLDPSFYHEGENFDSVTIYIPVGDEVKKFKFKR